MANKILVVDDLELNRELLQEMLEKEYDVMLAENGKQAIELIERAHEQLSVVLLDLIMPEVDGFTVLKWMREKDLIGRIPVMVISGETSMVCLILFRNHLMRQL